MITLNPLVVTGIMFGAMMLLMTAGLPLTFTLGAVGMMAAILLWGPAAMQGVYLNAVGLGGIGTLVALPLFIFMGIVLQRSGVADALYSTIHAVMGGVRGGLAMGTVVICALIAAMVGVSGAATVSMGLIALPAMLKRNYDKEMVTGCIQAGGALGFLIPPSVEMIMFGFLSVTSVGKLYAAGVFPGIMLATIYILYIGIRCFFQPNLGPALPPEERVSWLGKLKALKYLVLPGALVFLVLGFIFLGITSVTEASAIGAGGALICAAAYRRLTWRMLHESLVETAKVMGMVMWIGLSALFFSSIYTGLGAPSMIKELVAGLTVSPYVILAVILVSFFIMGMFLDDYAIMFITIPIYVPLIVSLGFNKVWFGTLFILSMQTAYLTPPFGYNLFYMRAVAPPEITMADIYRSVIPYVALQTIGIILVVIFPQIALWFPGIILG